MWILSLFLSFSIFFFFHSSTSDIMESIFCHYGRSQESTWDERTKSGIKVLKKKHLISLTDDLILASLYMSTEGGRYKVKKTTYNKQKKTTKSDSSSSSSSVGNDTPDPIDSDEATEMLRCMGGTIQDGGERDIVSFDLI